MKDHKFKPALIIKTIEKVLLGIIAILTVIAVLQEIHSIYINGKIQLADLLLLFIYTEVLGMIGIFYIIEIRLSKNAYKDLRSFFNNFFDFP